MNSIKTVKNCSFKVNWKYLKRYNFKRYRELNQLLQLELFYHENNERLKVKRINPKVYNLKLSQKFVNVIIIMFKKMIENSDSYDDIIKIIGFYYGFINLIANSEKQNKKRKVK